jgi:hypothetical protein
MFLPTYNAVKQILIWKIFIWADIGFTCCKKTKEKTTKTTTYWQYIDLYAGPEVRLFSGYAIILNTCFVTFTFGL